MKAIQERGQKAKEKILMTALDLFHKQGVNATSVDEILQEAKAGKSQFYHYFSNKDDLIHQVVQGFFEKLKAQQLPVKYDIQSWRDLEEWFGCFINFQKTTGCERGCPMSTIGYELTQEQELIRQDINIIFEYTSNSLAKFFYQLKVQGKLKKQADPDEMANLCVLIMQGGLITSKIKKDTKAFEASVGHTLTYLKSLTK